MGDVRFHRHFRRLQLAQDRRAALHAMSDEEVIGALAASGEDPLLANVLATEAMNRAHQSSAVWEVIGDGVILVGSDGRVVYANPAAERFLGIPQGAGGARDAHATLHAGIGCENANACPLALSLARAAGPPGIRYRVARAAGTLHARLCVYPIVREGMVEGSVVTLRDETDLVLASVELRERAAAAEAAATRALDEAARRRATERALRESEQRLADILENVEEAVLFYSPEGIVLFQNRAADRLYRTPSSSAVGKHLNDHPAWRFVEPAEAGRLAGLIAQGFAGVTSDVELTLTFHGDRRDVVARILPLRDDSGAVTGIVTIGQDVTSQKAERRDLALRAGELEERLSVRTRERDEARDVLSFAAQATEREAREIASLVAELDAWRGRLDADGRRVLDRLREETSHTSHPGEP